MTTINPTNSKKEEHSRIKLKSKSQRIKQKETFDTLLHSRISFNFQGAIDELLDDLKNEEKQFLENQSLYHLNRYRSIVEKILKKILEEGYETIKLKRLRRDKADFIIINKINSRLFNITKDITGKNNNAFNLLKAIEEIRGMIFDLLY